MKNVAILAMINTMAATVLGPLDVFYRAGVMWNHFNGQAPAPFFRTEVVTGSGAPFRCLSGVRIVPDGSIHDVTHPELIIVSAILDIRKTLERQGEVVVWLKHHHRRGMSRRSLERRFKAATGDTPLAYQQRIRVEAAKRLLEDGPGAFDEITYRVGYEDSSSFRRVFLRQTGLRPKEYRNRFHRA